MQWIAEVNLERALWDCRNLKAVHILRGPSDCQVRHQSIIYVSDVGGKGLDIRAQMWGLCICIHKSRAITVASVPTDQLHDPSALFQ